MRFLRSNWYLASGIIAGVYIGSFAAIKVSRPASLTSNDGPGRIYCAAYLPLRFAVASTQQGYWRSLIDGHWQTVKVIWNNPGNGYLEFEDMDGRPGRVFAGQAYEAKAGEVIDIHLHHDLQTWDDFSDRLIPGVDKVRRSKQSLQPTPPSRRG
jgi:hypothetical protein